MKLSKREFTKLLLFLSGFAGSTDLSDPPMLEELWGLYEEESEESLEKEVEDFLNSTDDDEDD